MKLIRVELKYCEGCGGLLLRTAGTAAIYCAPCACKMAELPDPMRLRHENASAPHGRDVDASAPRVHEGRFA